jgi:hypothetical protein
MCWCFLVCDCSPALTLADHFSPPPPPAAHLSSQAYEDADGEESAFAHFPPYNTETAAAAAAAAAAAVAADYIHPAPRHGECHESFELAPGSIWPLSLCPRPTPAAHAAAAAAADAAGRCPDGGAARILRVSTADAAAVLFCAAAPPPSVLPAGSGSGRDGGRDDDDGGGGGGVVWAGRLVLGGLVVVDPGGPEPAGGEAPARVGTVQICAHMRPYMRTHARTHTCEWSWRAARPRP